MVNGVSTLCNLCLRFWLFLDLKIFRHAYWCVPKRYRLFTNERRKWRQKLVCKSVIWLFVEWNIIQSFLYIPTFVLCFELWKSWLYWNNVLSNLLIVVLLANSYCQFVGAFNTLVHFFLTDSKVELFPFIIITMYLDR